MLLQAVADTLLNYSYSFRRNLRLENIKAAFISFVGVAIDYFYHRDPKEVWEPLGYSAGLRWETASWVISHSSRAVVSTRRRFPSNRDSVRCSAFPGHGTSFADTSFAMTDAEETPSMRWRRQTADNISKGVCGQTSRVGRRAGRADPTERVSRTNDDATSYSQRRGQINVCA